MPRREWHQRGRKRTTTRGLRKGWQADLEARDVRRLLLVRLPTATESNPRYAVQRMSCREQQALAATADPIVSECDWPRARGQAVAKSGGYRGVVVMREREKTLSRRAEAAVFKGPLSQPGGASLPRCLAQFLQRYAASPCTNGTGSQPKRMDPGLAGQCSTRAAPVI